MIFTKESSGYVRHHPSHDLYKLLPSNPATRDVATKSNSMKCRDSSVINLKLRFEPERCFSVSELPSNNRQIFPFTSPRARLIPVIATFAAMILIFMTALPAFAGLGEDAGSVQADQARMQASLRTTQAQAYTVQEIQAPTGIVVREYVSPASGKVFAVAWQGPWPPNMQQILASYFDQFQQAAQARAGTARAMRRPLVINLPGLVVESGGHMRSFAGRAYIPAMLPQGVTAEAIR